MFLFDTIQNLTHYIIYTCGNKILDKIYGSEETDKKTPKNIKDDLLLDFPYFMTSAALYITANSVDQDYNKMIEGPKKLLMSIEYMIGSVIFTYALKYNLKYYLKK